MFIDLDQISSTATFLCDPDLDFFHSRSLNNFGKPLGLSLFSVTLISTDSIPCIGIDLDEISLTVTLTLTFSIQGHLIFLQYITCTCR